MPTAFIVAGLLYGDEGKGATIDFICRTRDVELVVRYNGGSQAGHNVITPDGRHHTFSQFGSGMFVPGCLTHLSRFVLINPLNMIREERHLRELGIKDAFKRTSIDKKCVVITPFQRAVNRIMAYGGKKNSCQQGVGQARADHIRYGSRVLFAGDLRSEVDTREKLSFIQKISQQNVPGFGLAVRHLFPQEFDCLFDQSIVEELAKTYCTEWPVEIISKLELPNKNVAFEGAQGVLLDEVYGEVGFNTWTNTTFGNALYLLSKWTGQIKKIGVVRTYITRHGDGPLRTEDKFLDAIPEPHNCDSGPQGKFRRGKFDRKLFERSMKIVHPDWLAVNHCDVSRGFAIGEIPLETVKHLAIRGSGPTANDRQWTT